MAISKRHIEYWARREEEQAKHDIKDEAEYNKQINKIYRSTLDNVQKEIDSFYGRYADKEGISITEAKKRVNKADIEAYERKAKRYVEQAERDRRLNGGKTVANASYFSTKANDEMKLYNLTMKVNRLEMLKANIGLELIKNGAELDAFMEEMLQGKTIEELERQAGILGESIRDNAKAAHSIVNASFKSANFSDRIWLHQQELKAEIDRLVQSALIQGKNARALSKDIEKRFNVKAHEAERLARTEVRRVQTEAQKQSFERNGFTEFMFITNSRCCDACQALNGKVFKVEKLEVAANAPPVHPNCRCSTAAYSDRKEYEEWLDYLEKGGTTEQWKAFKAGKNNPLSLGNMSKEAFEKWKSDYYRKNNNIGLTGEELKALYDYGEGGYELLNAFGRFGEGSEKFNSVLKKYGNPDVKDVRETFNNLQNALNKFILDEDIVVHRAIRDISYMTDDISAEGLKKLIGKTITEKSFTSTSVKYQSKFEGKDPNAVHMEIVVPKGAKGAYIDKYVSKDEMEFLLAAGTKYKIVDGGTRTTKIVKYDLKKRDFVEVDKIERFLKVEVIPTKLASIAKNSTTPVIPKEPKSVAEAKDFKALDKYLKKEYNVSVENSVKLLDFGSVKDALSGLESVIKKVPDLKSSLKKVITSKAGVMSCNGENISFNPYHFENSERIQKVCTEQSGNRYWVKNASPASIGAHECAHAVEWIILQKNPNLKYDWQRFDAWNKCTEAKKIVSQACKNIKKTEFGKGKRNAELISTISRYAHENASETMAEAFADVYANGENASPLSIEIERLTLEKIKDYEGGEVK